MGALAGTVGGFLREYQTAVNIVSGLVVIFFGLNFLGVFKVTLFRGSSRMAGTGGTGFFSSALFGVVFSIGWTPCVGAFLGSALMLASQQGHVAEGMLMLLVYSLGKPPTVPAKAPIAVNTTVKPRTKPAAPVSVFFRLCSPPPAK